MKAERKKQMLRAKPHESTSACHAHDSRFRIMVACALSSLALFLSSCAVFFSDGEKMIGVIPRQPGSNVVFTTVLPQRSMAIQFHSAARPSSFREEENVTVTISNKSGRRTILLQDPRISSLVPPHASATLYNGSLAGLLEKSSFHVTTWEGRAPCELHIEFSTVSTLPEPIQVMYWYSSPPL
jgi:hypothetical protein